MQSFKDWDGWLAEAEACHADGNEAGMWRALLRWVSHMEFLAS